MIVILCLAMVSAQRVSSHSLGAKELYRRAIRQLKSPWDADAITGCPPPYSFCLQVLTSPS